MIVSVLGTGLIGTSIALGLRQLGWTTRGWDVDQANLGDAVALGAIEVASGSIAECVGGTDLVVVSVPPEPAAEVLAGLDTDSLVTDVVGVKAGVMEAGIHLPRFVSGHPMAGREVSGPGAADPNLFRGASWVLITDDVATGALADLKAIVSQLGAHPIAMTAAEHDDAVATISHLPQVLAAALTAHAAEHPLALGLAAGGFRDLTRVAASGSALWTELLVANRVEVSEALSSYANRLLAWAAALDRSDTASIEEWLETARGVRESMAAPVEAVHVGLADQPGEIARVGRAIGTGGVDVRDLQLRHAPHGGGGILTISVTPEAVEPLREALSSEGLLVIS